MAEIQKELIEKRTANSKTFDLGNGRRQLVTHIGAIHYKDNYADESEQWKDIDLTWEDNRITKAPYDLIHEGNKIIVRDKKTDDISTIELLDIGGESIPIKAWERSKGLARVSGITTLENVALDTDLEIVAEPTRVRFAYILKSDKAPTDAQFRVTGKIPLQVSAQDEEGELHIETSLVNGKLTEELIPENQDRPIKYPVRIDPTLNLQVGAGSDDCHRRLTPSSWDLDFTEQLAGATTYDLYKEGGGMRFINITIPKDYTIDTAYLTLRAAYERSGTVCNSRISAEAIDDAPTFADDKTAFDARWANRTAARVDWDDIPGWTQNVDYNSPEIKPVIQEIVNRPGWAEGAIVIFWEDFDSRSTKADHCCRLARSYEGSTTYAPKLVATYSPPPVVATTVTTQAATNVQATTATGNGNVTDNGGENPDDRQIEWGTSTGVYTGGSCSAGAGGEGPFSCGLTGLPAGTTIYCRAKAHNSAGWGYGGEVTFLTKPAAPANVAATDGAHTDKVVITWTKSTGATGYQVYRDDTPLGWLGDVATFNDTGAGAPTITPGAAAASDGLYADKVALSLSGQSANNGATHTYKVRARNATGESVDSGTNTGYRGVGSLTYQWQRSAADSDADYSNIPGATTASYDDTGAPKTGGRYYRCVENATGATQQISSSDRGYRVGETTYDTMVGFPTGWVWEKCDYEVSEKCPVGLETSWAWKVPTLAGPDKTPQGSPTLFSWGSE